MAQVKSYQDCASLCATRRNHDSRKIGNNTYLKRRGESFAVMLHSTDVVTYRPDGSIVLDSGGWLTVTTRDRMNEFSPIRVWSERGVWYAGGIAFADGITLRSDGSFDPSTIGDDPRETRRTRRRVAVYAKDFVTALRNGDVPQPSSGDCWFCMLFKGSGRDDHIRSHIEESYFVPSLLVNALKWQNVNLPIWMDRWWGSGKGMDLSLQIQRTLRRYLNLKLGLAV